MFVLYNIHNLYTVRGGRVRTFDACSELFYLRWTAYMYPFFCCSYRRCELDRVWLTQLPFRSPRFRCLNWVYLLDPKAKRLMPSTQKPRGGIPPQSCKQTARANDISRDYDHIHIRLKLSALMCFKSVQRFSPRHTLGRQLQHDLLVCFQQFLDLSPHFLHGLLFLCVCPGNSGQLFL